MKATELSDWIVDLLKIYTFFTFNEKKKRLLNVAQE